MSKDDFTKLTGVEKSAILLMSVQPNNAARVFDLMDDSEIREISQNMSSLGVVKPDIVERLIAEFLNLISETLSFYGNMENTERLLDQILTKDRVSNIMEDIRGPAGRSTWDKLANVGEDALAAYLKNEYPQTAALILSKVESVHAAKVLSVLPQDFTFDVIVRMLHMDSVKKEVLDNLEKVLQNEFISNLSKTRKYDSHELMAEIFNNFDRVNEAKFMGMLEEKEPATADRIKSLMFTFDDLVKVDAAGIQVLLRNTDKTKLSIALKGATPDVKDLFLSNMSKRASKLMAEEMEAMGPVRMRDVDEAQTEIIALTKQLADKGDIIISEGSDPGGDLVY